MTPPLTFDKSATSFILETFNKNVDEEGYVIDQETGERETNEFGEEIQMEDFAGVEKGSLILLDDDFNTLVNHVKRRREE